MEERTDTLINNLEQYKEYNMHYQVPNKSAEQLYYLVEEWMAKKYSGQVVLADKKSLHLETFGSLIFTYSQKFLFTKYSTPIRVHFKLKLKFESNSCKLELTNIRLGLGEKDSMVEYDIETFAQKAKTTPIGKNLATKVIYQILNEVDLRIKKVINEIKNVLQNETEDFDNTSSNE